ncbi:MAG: hypothetical protein H7343_08435 [Undibacterium sp.]|nr:hypothetical protein [Opitutaceae bacterium]
MRQDTVIYLTNTIIGVILACLLTYHWLRQNRSITMRAWMFAAWIMTAADILFALRPELPLWMGRVVATVMVTAGHGVLYIGAQRTAELPQRRKLIAVVLLFHITGLTLFLIAGRSTNWRMVMNGLIWAGLSLASFRCLRQARPVFWQPLLAPASAFLLHGVFHCLRVGAAIIFQVRGLTEASAALQTIGDLEVSFFMVALFVSVLIAHLQLRNEELSSALVEVQTLTGLLPICAWCRKVRADDGYWQKLEEYFVSHSRVKFTHGICVDCTKEQFPESRAVRLPD